MNVEHDTRPCTPKGHSAFRGYDAIRGKMQSLYGWPSSGKPNDAKASKGASA